MNGDAAEEVVGKALNTADIFIRLVGADAKSLAGLSEPPTIFAMPYADYLLSILLHRACAEKVRSNCLKSRPTITYVNHLLNKTGCLLKLQ
jgi:hypothetical protein